MREKFAGVFFTFLLFIIPQTSFARGGNQFPPKPTVVPNSDHEPSVLIIVRSTRDSEKKLITSLAPLIRRHYDGKSAEIMFEELGDYQTERESGTAEKTAEFLKNAKGPVDVYIFGHTNNAADWLPSKSAPEDLKKIRLVYNAGCQDGNEEQVKAWHDKGVKTVVGHPNNSDSWAFFWEFMDYWFENYPLGESVKRGNSDMATDMVPALMRKIADKYDLDTVQGPEKSRAIVSGDDQTLFDPSIANRLDKHWVMVQRGPRMEWSLELKPEARAKYLNTNSAK